MFAKLFRELLAALFQFADFYLFLLFAIYFFCEWKSEKIGFCSFSMYAELNYNKRKINPSLCSKMPYTEWAFNT